MKKLIYTIALMALSVPGWSQVVLNTDMSTTSTFITTSTIDVRYEFGFSWAGGVAVDASAGQPGNVIPPAPNGGSKGLKVECNNNIFDSSPFNDGFAAWATTQPATANYDIQVDAFNLYPPPLNVGGTGSTEVYGIAVQATAGDTIAVSQRDALTAINPAFGYTNITSGTLYPVDQYVAFGMENEAGAGDSNIWCYDPQVDPQGGRIGAVTGTVRNQFAGQVGVWNGAGSASNAYHSFDAADNTPPNVTNYSYAVNYPAGRVAGDRVGPGYTWATLGARVRGSVVTFTVNGNDIVSYTSPKTGKKAGVFMGDWFSSVSANPSYTLFTNFKISDYVAVNAASDWQMYN